jgi:hypothetical protein
MIYVQYRFWRAFRLIRIRIPACHINARGCLFDDLKENGQRTDIAEQLDVSAHPYISDLVDEE